MPHGCSVWPAYWSVGPDWPNGGEIDILEGVHDMPTNQYTLHTSEGCTLSHEGIEVKARRVNDQCAVSGVDNRGCAFVDTDDRSYGKPFNMVAGGVFAHLWNSDGIKVWHFARGEIPGDIEAQQPNPDTWGPPVAFWSPATCDMSKHFYEHSLVIDTTICGDWAGGPSYAAAGCAGTCEQAVANTTLFKCEPLSFVFSYPLILTPFFFSRGQVEDQLHRYLPSGVICCLTISPGSMRDHSTFACIPLVFMALSTLFRYCRICPLICLCTNLDRV
jgi:hypothetical protein